MFSLTYLLIFATTVVGCRVAEPPSAPRGPVSVAGRTPDSAEIRWSPADDSGGSALQGYVIELRETSRNYWRRVATVGPTTTSYTLRDLTPGAEYVVRIIAKNDETEGTPLTSDHITMPKSKSNSAYAYYYYYFAPVLSTSYYYFFWPTGTSFPGA